MLLLENLSVGNPHGRVLDGVDLIVRRGETYGLVAADPRSRVVVIELLQGRRRPDRGRVRVDGLDPVSDTALLTDRVCLLDPALWGDPIDGFADILLVEAAADQHRALERLLAGVRTCGRHPPVTVLVLTDDLPLAARVCERVGHLGGHGNGSSHHLAGTTRPTLQRPPEK